MKWLIGILVGVISFQIAGAQEVAKRELSFAFFAQGRISRSGGGVRGEDLLTDLTFTNPGQRNAEIRVQVFSRDGTQLVVHLLRSDGGDLLPNPFVLVGQASSTVSLAVSDTLLLGWVKIESSEPITSLERLRRAESIRSGGAPTAIGPPLAAVAMISSIPTPDFSLAVVDDHDWGSGVSIAVPAGQNTITGVLTLVDAFGAVVTTKQVSVSQSSQLIRTATELFPELISRRNGTILGQFNGDVIVTSLRFGKSAAQPYTSNLVSFFFPRFFPCGPP